MTEHPGLPAPVVHDQTRAGLLHNTGKLAISNRILDKPDPLTDEEFARVKQHPGLTYDVLARVASFRDIAGVAANHHGRLDGTGYHLGVDARELNLPSRVLAVADVFDALSQDRSYRPVMPMEGVLAILKKESGQKLSPEAVEALEDLVSKGEI